MPAVFCPHVQHPPVRSLVERMPLANLRNFPLGMGGQHTVEVNDKAAIARAVHLAESVQFKTAVFET